MARETYAALQAKIEKEINKLQKKAEVLQTKRRKPVIASIITSMREYDITQKRLPPPMAPANPSAPQVAAARPVPPPAPPTPSSALWRPSTATPKPAKPGAVAARHRAGSPRKKPLAPRATVF